MRTETFEWTAAVLPPEADVSGLAWLGGIQLGTHPAPHLAPLATAELVGVERGRVDLIATAPHPRASTTGLLLATAIDLVALTLAERARGAWTPSGMSTTWSPMEGEGEGRGYLIVSARVIREREDAVQVVASVADGAGRFLASAATTLVRASA